MTDTQLIDKLLTVADAEIGYLEKKSNADLDDKTANAGSNNYTKYNRDMKKWAGSAGINDQWCQNFVDWCFVTAFGIEGAKKLIHVFTNYTPTGSTAFKKRGAYISRGSGAPKRGDVIYFYSTAKKRIGHVGIVEKVTSSTVYTIEGNTSGANKLVTNGGGVKRKSYSLYSSYIDGYGRVDYGVLAGETADAMNGVPTVLRYSDVGDQVQYMQRMLLKWDPKCLPEYGADGDFGSETRKAVTSFQAAHGLDQTGVYDAATRQALLEKVGEFVEITGGSVNVRTAPSTATGQIIGVAHKGDRLAYQGQRSSDGWYLVEFKEQNAWVSGKYGKLVE